MDNLMKNLMKSSLLSSIALAILGLLLIFQSEVTIVTISYVLGAFLVAIGVIAILNYKKDLDTGNKNDLNIIYGIVSAILGIIVISNPEGIASIIPFVIGAIIILNSGTKIQYSMELKKENNELWKSTLILSLITFLCGFLLIFNPFKGAVFITKVVGILILAYSILDIISTLVIKNTFNEIHTAIEEGIVEAEVVEEKHITKKRASKKKKENKKTLQEESQDEIKEENEEGKDKNND